MTEAVDLASGWRPYDVLFGLVLVLLGGKELWPYLFKRRTSPEAMAETLAKETEAALLAKEAHSVTTEKDSQGRYMVYGFAHASALQEEIRACTSALQAVCTTLQTFADRVKTWRDMR